MNHVNYTEDLFEPIPDYRKFVLLSFLIRKDFDLLGENGFLKKDISRLCKELENLLMEKNEY